MAKVRPFGVLAATLMLTASLAACGGGDSPSAAQEPAETPSAPEVSVEAAKTTLAVGALPEYAQSPAVTGMGGATTYGSVEELAQALESGAIDMAIVSDVQSSVLYNELDGRGLLVDAFAGDGEELVCSVVSLATFGERPEEVVAYVAAHGGVCEESGMDFLSGLAMQDAVTLRVKQAYADDPSNVGGTMPPDNFYFLG